MKRKDNCASIPLPTIQLAINRSVYRKIKMSVFSFNKGPYVDIGSFFSTVHIDKVKAQIVNVTSME